MVIFCASNARYKYCLVDLDLLDLIGERHVEGYVAYATHFIKVMPLSVNWPLCDAAVSTVTRICLWCVETILLIRCSSPSYHLHFS